MTKLLERPKAAGKRPGPLAVGLPQVNLLPPEVRAARGVKTVKRWLLVALIGVVVLIIGSFVAAIVALAVATADLEQVQAETAALKAEEATYAEVPLVLNALESSKEARELGMSTEVQWKPYFDAITGVLPEGVTITTITLSGAATPTVAPSLPASPLLGQAVGQIDFVVETSVVPDTAAWIDALNSIPGFADAWVTSAAIQDEEGGTHYAVESSVQLTELAYAKRFAVTESEN
jgi:Tfp pilus assembly protein PilN